MNIKHALGLAALAAAGFSSSLASASGGRAGPTQPLAIPIVAPRPPKRRSWSACSPSARRSPSPPWPSAPTARLLAGGGYQEVLLWDLAKAKLPSGSARGSRRHGPRLAFRKDGRLLAVADGMPRTSGGGEALRYRQRPSWPPASRSPRT